LRSGSTADRCSPAEDRLCLELIRKMTPFLAQSTPFRFRRSLAKASTNSGEAQAAHAPSPTAPSRRSAPDSGARSSRWPDPWWHSGRATACPRAETAQGGQCSDGRRGPVTASAAARALAGVDDCGDEDDCDDAIEEPEIPCGCPSDVPDRGSGTARVQIRRTQPTVVVKTASKDVSADVTPNGARLLRRSALCNDLFFSGHCERSEAISLQHERNSL
jgi:hypothetical protein